MRSLGLQVGFGQSICDQVPYLLERNITLVRQDLQDVPDELLHARLTELDDTGVQGYFIMRGWQLKFAQPGQLVELVNEPTLDYPNRPAMTPEAYAAEWNTYGADAQARGVRLYALCPHNIYRETMDWCRQVWALMDVKPRYVAVHRYPEHGGFEVPHPGFASRDAEVQALRDIIGDVPICLSEFGYHNGPRKVRYGPFGLFSRTETWTPEQSAAQIRQECEFWPKWGTDAAILYQINSSHTDPEDQYGVKYPDGSDKVPIVDVFRAEGAA